MFDASGAQAQLDQRMARAHAAWRRERSQRRERMKRARGAMARASTPEEMEEAVLKIQHERRERGMENAVPVPQTVVQEVVRQLPRVMVQEVVKQVPKIQVLSESLRKLPSMCRELEEALKQVAVPTPVVVSAPTVVQQAPTIVGLGSHLVTVAPTVYGGGYGGGGVGYGGGAVDRRDPRSPPPRHEATLDVRHSLRSPSRSPPPRLLRRYHGSAYDVRRVPRAGRVRAPTMPPWRPRKGKDRGKGKVATSASAGDCSNGAPTSFNDR